MTEDNNTNLFALLGVPADGLRIDRVEFRLWGKEHLFSFVYQPGANERSFTVLFKDCHTYTWSAMADIEDGNTTAKVLGVDLGGDGYRKPATITTDVFEVTVGYGELVIDKDW